MKKFMGAALIGAAIGQIACLIPVYMDEGRRFDRSSPAYVRTYDFAPGGALRIDNAFGNIILIGWDRDQVEIAAEETWDESAGAAAERERSGVVPRIDVAASNEGLSIKARSRDEEFTGDRIVHLLIRAPHHVLLKSIVGRRGRISISDMYGEAVLRLEDGDIRVENYSGTLDGELLRGSIQAEMIDLRPEDRVRLVIGEGPVFLLLEPAFNGRLEAEAPAGSFFCDFPLDPAPDQTRGSGKIGTGEGARVTISARKGTITVLKSAG